MTSKNVVALYSDLENLGVQVWIDGGWGVDALLEEQTRMHEDVDIVIQEKDLSVVRNFLESKGYSDIPRDDSHAWNFVLGDKRSHLIDIHVINLDSKGNGVYGPIENGIVYPVNSLLGVGRIDGVPVDCLTAQYQIESHSGYSLRQKDYKDVAALCKKFNLPLPERYKDLDQKL